ncbi:MAG TPA: phosphoribosyltransferase [Rhabdochlamydiaceae bacterium]|nr:phosphoribosyltransferase [Rhabdochlamydiaceae bacterium]
MLFKDRSDAGRQLVPLLRAYKDQENTVVLGLARGGVVTAYEIAKALHLPLGVIVVRKIGAPGNEELALGAITEKGEGIFNDHLISLLSVSQDYLKRQIEKEKQVAKARLALYLGKKAAPNVQGKVVILVDDGIATGASMRVAIHSVRSQGAKKIVLAVPVAAPDSLKKIEKEVDETHCLQSPSYFEAVGSFYKKFEQVSDDEIVQLLLSL